MEVEESDVRKSKGRTGRSNSSSTKDLKSDKTIVKETNGEAGNNVSDLPNGEAMTRTKKEGDIDIEDHDITEDESGNIVCVTGNYPKLEQSEKECNSHASNKKVNSEGTTKKKAEAADADSLDEEEFLGFESGDCDNTSAEILAKLIEKYEKDIATCEEKITLLKETDLSQSDVYRSGASSPMKVDGMNEILGGEDICSSNASSPSVASGFSGELRSQRGKKSQHVDLSNPAFRKPLDMGWRRELVFRNTGDVSQRRMADVYYYTPTGKKVRSAREVLEHLPGSDLSDENFTFFKMALGINDPSKETIRDAKRTTLREASGTPPQKVLKISKSPKTDGAKMTPGTPVAPTSKDVDVGSSPKTPFSRGAFPRIKVTGSGSKGLSSTSSPARPKPLGRPKKDATPLPEGELEMGMLPPSWKEPTAVSGARKVTPPSTPTGLWTSSPAKEDVTAQDVTFMQHFMQNLSSGYTALRHVFEFLKVHELLRASRVCRMWYDLAGHPSLWRTVRMKNSQVLDWEGCASTLSARGTRHLDLRKMLLDPSKSQDTVWTQFCAAIARIGSLRHLDLCRCPASVVGRVATQCPQLTNLIALFIQDPNIDLKALSSLSHLEELRLKGVGVGGLKLKSSLDVLTSLTTLRHLSLTTVKELGKAAPEILQSLPQLESLELGECSDFPESFGTECLPRLTNLKRLRLEMGQGRCPTFVILSGVKSLPLLIHLELVNFDIKPGFDQALAGCANLRRLLLIPTYLTQSATTNHMVLGGVTRLSASLSQFVWGVTHELLHVTELFVDQCEGQKGGAPRLPAPAPGAPAGANAQPPAGKKNSSGDSIPILRPVPGWEGLGLGSDVKSEEEDPSKPSPQVDILPLSQLQKLLASQLPDTNVSILKIPFHATWRQTL